MLQNQKADLFRSYHHSTKIFILPNAWDVPTAKLFENVGFRAVATTSAGMMVALGYEDGEYIPRQEYIASVARIAKVLTVPLSVDLVSGFGRNAKGVADTVKAVADVGAVGVNIEDFEHTSKKLFSIEEQVEKIKAIKKLTPNIFVNARTDALRFASGDEEERFKEALKRGEAYRDAGADCLYPMGLVDKEKIARYVDSIKFPVNIMLRKGIPSIKELEELHVARLSFGPSAAYAVIGFLKIASRQILEKYDYSMMLENAIDYEELNSLAKKIFNKGR
ncbi:MAG: isocitrate lyase/phosphoenolpyruvate mutase family protein [Conexivisphaerales archaeon]